MSALATSPLYRNLARRWSRGQRGRWPVVVGLAALVGSAATLAMAPLAIDDSYSWFEHTTSESGAQGVVGAWVARTGFLLFGFAVAWIAVGRRRAWGRPATAFHLAFAGCMIAVAVYSARSWIPVAPYDRTEDLLHSIAASVMGFAFAFGIAAVALLGPVATRWRALDWVAIAASVILPIGMSQFGSIDGALQRLMFAIAYLWYAKELLSLPADRDLSVPYS